MTAHRATLDVLRTLIHHVARVTMRRTTLPRYPQRQPHHDRVLAGGTDSALVRGERDIPKLGRDHHMVMCVYVRERCHTERWEGGLMA